MSIVLNKSTLSSSNQFTWLLFVFYIKGENAFKTIIYDCTYISQPTLLLAQHILCRNKINLYTCFVCLQFALFTHNTSSFLKENHFMFEKYRDKDTKNNQNLFLYVKYLKKMSCLKTHLFESSSCT